MSVFREAIYGVRFEDERKEGVIERREEIVRCKDCRHYDRMNDDEGMCMVPDDDGDYARWMVDDVGYCYLGERRDE